MRRTSVRQGSPAVIGGLLPYRLSALAGALALAGCAATAPDPPPAHEPVVADLIALLADRPDLRGALSEAIRAADVRDIGSVDDLLVYVDELVTWIPVEREIVPKVLNLHYVINQAPDDALNEDPVFGAWLHDVSVAWGEFLDTPASAQGIETFTSLPAYAVGDYIEGPSGWRTFNQFFARAIRPGLRPVEDPDDDGIVVAPADAIVMGTWPVGAGSSITVKGVEWKVEELLDGSPYAAAFGGGTYTHSFLRVTDYHRYHAPVGGVVKEVRNVHGRVYIDVVRNEDGTLSGANGDTYQFNQERGLIVIDSPTAGLVAMVPVGMSLISSVALTPEVGDVLRKGDLLGYFQFGGSDIVLIFQEGVEFEAETGTRYLQGQRIGRVRGRNATEAIRSG